MKIWSRDFQHGGLIPRMFTCDGTGISPHLEWSNPPVGTKSFALIVNDPDAPKGKFIHWIVYNIPPNASMLQRGMYLGLQLKNDFGKQDYGGPCPPKGMHRYIFKLFALNVWNPRVFSREDLRKILKKHTIGTATMIGKYER